MSNRLFVYVQYDGPVNLEQILKKVKTKFPSQESGVENEDGYVFMFGPYSNVYISESTDFDSMLEIFVWQRWNFMFNTECKRTVAARRVIENLCTALGASEYWFTCEELMYDSKFFDDSRHSIDELRNVSLELNDLLSIDSYDYDHPMIHMTIE